MKDYTVYFVFYGRKMKTTIKANSISDAQSKIRAKIDFIKTIEEKNDVDFLKGIFGIK